MSFNIKHRIKEKLDIGRQPDFLVIGAAKCGTSSIMKYLEHYCSNYSPPLIKETRYFTEFNHFPERHYHAYFPRRRNCLTGEGTPDYLYYPLAPKLIKDYGKVNKFVVVLRNPVERAFSQYIFQNYINKSEVSDPWPFAKSIRESNKRFYTDEYVRFYSEYKHFSYVERGDYYSQLKRWHSFFCPEQIHVMFLEELKADFSGEMVKLFTFLGLEHNGKPFEQRVYNKSSHDGLPRMDPEDESYLKELYRTPNSMLFDLLNKKPIWE